MLLCAGARALGPVLSQLAASPMRMSVDSALDALRNMSPSLVQMVMPLMEQLAPVVMDVSQGRQEFSPSPTEATALIRTYYTVNRNLLIRCVLHVGCVLCCGCCYAKARKCTIQTLMQVHDKYTQLTTSVSHYTVLA